MMLKNLVAIMFITMLLVSACDREERPSESLTDSNRMHTIVAVGDSLTAGYTFPENLAYPALVAVKLAADGHRAEVINSGVSGETSSGTLARIDWVLTLNPDIVILETGANDGLRGTDPQLLENNLRAIIEKLQSRDIVVVLAGMEMVWNMGPAYVSKFNKIYPALAREYQLIFFPFFLKDVAMHKTLNLADGLHPNERGYEIIAENIYPYVVEAVKRLEK